MCYYTYFKNNRHNHGPTWKFFTTLKIATFPVSTQFQTPVPNIQCFSPGVWFVVNIQAQQSMCYKVFLSSQLESLVWELIRSLHCFRGAGPSCLDGDCVPLNQYSKREVVGLRRGLWGFELGAEDGGGDGCGRRSVVRWNGSLVFGMRTRGVQIESKRRAGRQLRCGQSYARVVAWVGRTYGWERFWGPH